VYFVIDLGDNNASLVGGPFDSPEQARAEVIERRQDEDDRRDDEHPKNRLVVAQVLS
jgi:hypothetical protein